MTYIVNDSCIKCKHMDCVTVCPVDCFYEGESMLVINTDECIDCGVCEPECPADAIRPDTADGAAVWVNFNQKYAELWPNVTHLREEDVPADATEWHGVADKMRFFVETAGKGDTWFVKI